MLATILNELEKSFEAEEKHLVNQWTKYCNHINKNVQFHEKNKLISGLFTGINQINSLLTQPCVIMFMYGIT